jgi:maltose O-acetyltransferase
LVILDCARVTIGDDVLMGPRCQLITASHPLDPTLRCKLGLEDARPITIGDRVWLGAGGIDTPF